MRRCCAVKMLREGAVKMQVERCHEGADCSQRCEQPCRIARVKPSALQSSPHTPSLICYLTGCQDICQLQPYRIREPGPNVDWHFRTSHRLFDSVRRRKEHECFEYLVYIEIPCVGFFAILKSMQQPCWECLQRIARQPCHGGVL
jgi:hypothetical protein